MAGVHAQELLIKSFKQSENELLLSQNRRTDGNGQPCALVKVQLANYQIDRLEGSYVGDVADHGIEVWTYWTSGTKYIKIYFRNYLPITIRTADYGISSLEGNCVYVLTLYEPQKEKKVRLGLVGGMNLSMPSLDVHTGDHYGNKVSFHIGSTINLRLSEQFSLQGALLFSGKGYSNENHLDDYDQHAHAYYIDIPIEASYAPFCSENFELRLFAGPYVAIGIAGNIEEEGIGYKYSNPFFDKYSNFDIGASAGASAIVASHYLLSAGYQYGFGNDYKNRCLAFSLGYIF